MRIFDCGGYATTTLYVGEIVDFAVQKVKGYISAFMVKTDGHSTDNGFSNTCTVGTSLISCRQV
jgi:hypothetical protein